MRLFCCVYCGVISDNFKIEPIEGTNSGYNYSITCPTCLRETTFSRKEPFLSDIKENPMPIVA